MATVKEMRNKIEAGATELQQGTKETTDRVKEAVAKKKDRFDTYAKEEFWG